MAIRNNYRNANVSFVIQAGGLSSRMGTDKGLVLLQNKPLVAWILDQLTRFDTEKIIITNNPTSYSHFGVPIYQDVIPGIGALGGLLSAITYASHELIFVLACDMPFIDLALLELMLNLSDNHDVVIPRLGNPENTEPFRALYRKTCLKPIRAAVASGKRRVISFFPEVRVRYVDLPEFSQADPSSWTFFNINTPEDIIKAEAYAHTFSPSA